METLVGIMLLIASQLNYMDKQWERVQAANPVLYQLDNRDWKTWLWHTGITVGAGHAIAILPGINKKTGMRFVVGTYAVREIYNVLVDKNPKYGDAVMDVMVPLLTVEIIW